AMPRACGFRDPRAPPGHQTVAARLRDRTTPDHGPTPGAGRAPRRRGIAAAMAQPPAAAAPRRDARRHSTRAVDVARPRRLMDVERLSVREHVARYFRTLDRKQLIALWLEDWVGVFTRSCPGAIGYGLRWLLARAIFARLDGPCFLYA